jgi:hypothetical protein
MTCNHVWTSETWCMYCKIEKPEEETVMDVLEERQKTYGDFGDLADCSQAIKGLLFRFGKGRGISNSQWEALDLIAMKLARIVCGDPSYPDNWDDIAGYARLGKGERPQTLQERIAEVANRAPPACPDVDEQWSNRPLTEGRIDVI